jgi:hypothetical protein
MRTAIFLSLGLFLCGVFCLGRADAFYQSRDSNYNHVIPSGGGSPTWTNQTTGINPSCGFATTCSITSVAVTSGVVVVAVAGVNNSAGASTVTSMTICGTSATLIASPSAASNIFMTAIFYATGVTGGSCTVSATASGTGAWNEMGIALGTLNNLTSSTPGTDCTGVYTGTQAAPYPCTSGITVAAGGFGIVGMMIQGPGVTLTSSNVTIDAQEPTTAIGIGHTTTSNTPQFGGFDNDYATIVAAPWR